MTPKGLKKAGLYNPPGMASTLDRIRIAQIHGVDLGNPVNLIDIYRIGQFYRVDEPPKVARINPELPWKAAAAYRFLNCGLRFSANAAMPSFWSAVAKVAWNRRRSNLTPSESVVS